MSIGENLIAFAVQLRGRADPATEASYGASFDNRLDDTISLADRNEGRIGIENLINNLVDFEVSLTSTERADLIRLANTCGLTDPLPTRCQKVLWHHNHATDPIELWSEIDLEGLEVRKLERFRDGHWGFADRNNTTGDTRLGTATLPPLAAMNTDPQFEGDRITAVKFDEVWERTTGRSEDNEHWVVQATWQDGSQARSYSPVLAETVEQALQIASEMEATLSHFTGLAVTMSRTGDRPSEATSKAPAPTPLLHILIPGGTATLCGSGLDVSNAAMAANLLHLSTGQKCETCLDLLANGGLG